MLDVTEADARTDVVAEGAARISGVGFRSDMARRRLPALVALARRWRVVSFVVFLAAPPAKSEPTEAGDDVRSARLG